MDTEDLKDLWVDTESLKNVSLGTEDLKEVWVDTEGLKQSKAIS